MQNFPFLRLSQLPSLYKQVLACYLVVLCIGVSIGIVFIGYQTQFTGHGTVQHFNGSNVEMEELIPEKFPQSIHSLLINTHGHIISFAFIFLTVILIFGCSSFPFIRFKKLLMIEPFISSVTTFGCIWAIRFIHPHFVVLMFVSSVILYLSFFMMVGWSLKELLFSKSTQE